MDHPYKYVVILGDGMADRPTKELDGRTPLEAAHTPTWDAMAKTGLLGMARTTPEGFAPGSDICNLSVMGYDPRRYHTGRSPLEAASLHVPMKDTDTTFRTNFVTLSTEPQLKDRTMVDYSAGEISTKEAAALIDALNQAFENEHFRFFPGTSYRHILRWDAAPDNIPLTPPHDISHQKVADYLPKDPTILSFMEKSYEILKDHPVNLRRMEQGLAPANSIWIWGQGKKTILPPFQQKYGVKGGAISAVDLVKGIAVSADMEVFPVEGATGNYETNFEGKGQMAIQQLRQGCDLIYLHVEAPDECGHRGQWKEKVYSIEKLDEITAAILAAMKQDGTPLRVLVMPDHPTPLATLTHAADPVPFLLFDSQKVLEDHPNAAYTEAQAAATGRMVDPADTLMDLLIHGE